MRRRHIRIVVLLGLGLGFNGRLWATPIHVRPGGSDANDGSSWADAVATIGRGVELAVTPGDSVLVSNGTYTVTQQILITHAITVRSVNGSDVTIVAGQGMTTGEIRCFAISNSAAVLDGFTVEQGRAPIGDVQSGRRLGSGAMLFAGTIRNSTFRNNGGQDGGGVYFASGAAVVSNCVFYGNDVNGYGGGLGNFFHAGGHVVDCVVSNNTGHGGGLYIRNGLVENCWIAGNFGRGLAAGVAQVGGTNRNSVIVGNRVEGATGAGGIELSLATFAVALLENATVADNLSYSPSATDPAGIKALAGTTVRNAISYNNWGFIENTFAANTVTYSLMNPPVSGAGNIGGDPLFLDSARGDYRLSLTSPAIDTGTNLAWMAGATDVAGNPRISPSGGTADMGAHEAQVDALAGSFEADARKVLTPQIVTFTATVAGPDLDNLTYLWSFTNSAVIDVQGSDKNMVTNEFPAGIHTVTLTVSNTLTAATATMTRANFIKASPPELFVRADAASPAFPYADWTTAAADIQTAVDVATDGAVVWVSNGVYTVTDRIRIEEGITVESVNGRDVTGINGNQSTGGVHLHHTNAVLRGFAVTNSVYPSSNVEPNYGGGIQLYAGEVDDCLIAWNKAARGGALNLSHLGTVRRSRFLENTTYGSYAAGITHLPFGRSGVIESCEFRRHSGGNHTGTLHLNGGILRNSLIANNTGHNGTGGVAGPNTLIENCTIALNHNTTVGATLAGGLIGNAATKLYNSILDGNSSASVNPDYYLPAGATVSHSRLTPAYAGAVESITDDPLLVSPGTGDFTLSPASPCIDQGTNLAWMTTTLTVDLAGNTRVQGDDPDMGCFEFDLDSLAVSFVVDAAEGFDPLAVWFNVAVSGLNTNNVYYRWSFEDGGATFDIEGYDLSTVSNDYASGNYTAYLMVSNAFGETATYLLPSTIRSGPVDAYVTVAGGNPPTFPYDDWDHAADNLQDALDAAVAGTRVWVGQGVYNLSTTVVNSAGAIVRGVGGAANTVLKGNHTFYLYGSTHTRSVLDGVTLTGGGGSAQPGGGGAYLFKGALLNSLVVSNAAYRGGGVYLDSADTLVSNCVIRANSTEISYGGGIAAVMYPGGLITHCEIIENVGPWTAGVYLGPGGTLRNSLVVNNRCTGGGANHGGGVHIGAVQAPGLVESCTIAGNSTTVADSPGGLYAHHNTTNYNTIIVHNTAPTPGIENHKAGDNVAMYHCNVAPPWTGTGSGNLNVDPGFVNPATGNFRLTAESPLVNAGLNRDWMQGAVDLDGRPRILSGNRPGGQTVDIGAYERVAPRGVLVLIH